MTEIPQTVLRAAAERMATLEAIIPALGHMLLNMQQGDLGISTKTNDMDLVTRADVASEEMILNHIRKAFPGDKILAEESATVGTRTKADDEFTWIIDPVDGTINYAHGLPLFGVCFGLMYGNTPVAGTVDCPALGDTYRAVLGQGATKNGAPISVSSQTDLSRALIVTGFPYNRVEIMSELMQALQGVMLNARGIRRTGVASVDFCWLAEGRFDGYYEMNLAPWDTCAGGVIAQEAGGRITDLDGLPFDPFRRVFVTSNGRLHERLLEVLTPLKAVAPPAK